MRQFDVYVNTDTDSNGVYPYFVDVQTELLDTLNSRVVIPLTAVDLEQGMPNNICPRVNIENESYYLLTYQITTVSCSFLKKHESCLLFNRTEIINSIDFLISGI